MRISKTRAAESQASKGRRWALLSALVVLLVAVLSAAYLGWPSARPRGRAIAVGGEPIALINAFQRQGPASLAEQLADKVDANQDDWETEVLNETAQDQFAEIGRFIEHPEEIDLQRIAPLVTDDFACQVLRPAKLVEILADDNLVVRRPLAESAPDEGDLSAAYRRAEGLVEALQHLAEALDKGQDRRVKFKLFRIEKAKHFFSTRSFFEASARTDDEGVQLNAIWHCRWRIPEMGTSERPRLEWISIEQFEEVVVRAKRGQLFVDCTEAVLGANDSYRTQVLPGLDQWVQRMDNTTGMSIFGYHGVTVGDVNGDGREDIYVCDSGGLPNRLYVQQPNGTLTDVSAEAGVDFLDHSTSSLLIDLDNDGDQDLAVVMRNRLLISANDGSGRFTPRGRFNVVSSPRSICAADYDGDGDLDIYLCGYSAGYDRKLLPAPLPYHDAHNGGRNTLLRNDGNFVFFDATAESGLDTNNSRFSFAAAWEDYDNDGDLDLYVANDFGRNNLYRNEGGHFTDVAAEFQIEDIASGMSVSWGDYNRDGWMDVYVANMFSAAGSRVTYQRRFGADKADQTVADTRRMARGNSLFANRGGYFDDVSVEAGVTMGRWAWASNFADINNDGWLDLVVANGFITTQDTGDL